MLDYVVNNLATDGAGNSIPNEFVIVRCNILIENCNSTSTRIIITKTKQENK